MLRVAQSRELEFPCSWMPLWCYGGLDQGIVTLCWRKNNTVFLGNGSRSWLYYSKILKYRSNLSSFVFPKFPKFWSENGLCDAILQGRDTDKHADIEKDINII